MSREYATLLWCRADRAAQTHLRDEVAADARRQDGEANGDREKDVRLVVVDAARRGRIPHVVVAEHNATQVSNVSVFFSDVWML
jgi:hypothetical protein